MRDGSVHGLRLARLAPTVVCWLFWLWLRGWPTTLAIVTVAGTSALLVLLLSPARLRRELVAGVIAALTVSNLAGFYTGFEDPGPLHHRIASVPAGHALFSLSVLWALGDSLFSLERPLVKWTVRYAHALVYAASLVAVVLFTVDSYFMGEGKAFKYPAYPPPQPARVFPADEGYVHASERLMVDLRGTRFAQRKPDGTTRIVLNGASTMWGHGLPENEAPAAVLRRLLAERFPDRRFEVVNLAWSGKYQMNELVDAAVTVPHWQPDLVLSFNGFNELWFGEGASRFEGMPFWQEWQTAALSVPASKALLYEYTQYGKSVWPSQIFHSEEAERGLKEPDLYEPPRYYDYLFATSRTLADHGIRYVHAFCPNAIEMDADETKTLSRGAGDLASGGSFAGLFDEARQRRRLSKQVVERAMQRSYDAMAPLAGMRSDEAFLDAVHLSGTGVRAVMSDVATHLPEWLEAPLRMMTGPAQPESFAPLRLSAKAAAPFFTVGVGRRNGGDLVTNGSVGVVEASPRLALPAGRYRARWYGTVGAAGQLRADIVSVEGATDTKQYAETRAEVSPGQGEQLLVSVDAQVEQPVRNVQYRVFVESRGTNITFQQVVFEQLRDEQAAN